MAHLLRETAEGMGQLVIQHVRLAQLEVMTYLRATGSRAALIGGLLLLTLVGYALTMAGLALLIAANRRLAFPFIGIGMLHVAGGGIAILVSVRSLRGARPLSATSSELGQSAQVLRGAAARADTSGEGASAAGVEVLRGR